MAKWNRDSILPGFVVSIFVMCLVGLGLWINNQRLVARDGFFDPKSFKGTPEKILEEVKQIKVLQQQQTNDVHDIKALITAPNL